LLPKAADGAWREMKKEKKKGRKKRKPGKAGLFAT
jgi:hypothetical protein